VLLLLLLLLLVVLSLASFAVLLLFLYRVYDMVLLRLVFNFLYVNGTFVLYNTIAKNIFLFQKYDIIIYIVNN